MKPVIGTIQSVDLRTVWPHEASDFTPWLAENLTYLSDAVGIDLELVETEAQVGGFSLDILAKDAETDKLVAIENQFGVTDHSHLGKLLTYAAGYNVGAVIWLAETVREEHRQALDWLNQHSTQDVDFFAVRIEAMQIDDSKPAVVFQPVVAPNEWAKEKRSESNARMSELKETYREFFQPIIDEVRKDGFKGLANARSQNWIYFTSPIHRVQYRLRFSKQGFRAELYIAGRDSEENTQLLEWLHQRMNGVELPFFEPLEWEPNDGHNACRVAVYTDGDVTERERWPKLRQWGIDRLRHMKRAFDPLLEDYARRGGQTHS